MAINRFQRLDQKVKVKRIVSDTASDTRPTRSGTGKKKTAPTSAKHKKGARRK